MKDELGGEIMTKCIRLRVKIWYLKVYHKKN